MVLLVFSDGASGLRPTPEQDFAADVTMRFKDRLPFLGRKGEAAGDRA